MKHPHIHHWLEQIYTTQETELDCNQLRSGLAAFVEYELTGEDLPETAETAVRLHLKQCPDCAEEYVGLKALAELDARNALPEVDSLLAQFEPEASPVTIIQTR